jgi:hypothetical protein
MRQNLRLQKTIIQYIANKMKKLMPMLIIFLVNSCALPASEQSKLDKFPECDEGKYRLSQELNRDEYNCIAHKELLLRNEVEQKRRYQEYENAKKIKAQEIELSNKKIANYMNSEKGKADKKTCDILISKALSGMNHISFDVKDYSRSTDDYLSCTALVKYPSLSGYQLRTLTVIYNEINDVMQTYYR